MINEIFLLILFLFPCLLLPIVYFMNIQVLMLSTGSVDSHIHELITTKNFATKISNK